MSDMVNHPDYFNTGRIEVEECLLAFFCLMLVFVVRCRSRIVSAGAVNEDIARSQITDDLPVNFFQCFFFQNVCLIAF